jgi:mono/diheme cytochrome c family protein
MPAWWVGFAVVLGTAALGVGPAAAAGDPAAGAAMAEQLCTSCHVVSPTQASGSDRAPSFAGIANLPGTNSGVLHAFLSRPHGLMPPLVLSNRQIDDVTAYILSLRK